jgi:ABC-type Mn2+/Zn2+ transport system permease subunit
MLTIIQRVYVKEQSGLDHYIFGNAAAMSPEDSMVFGAVSLIVLFVGCSLLLQFKDCSV